MDYYTFQNQASTNLQEILINPSYQTFYNTNCNNEYNSQLYDLSIPRPLADIPLKTDDALWIETWLSRIGKIQINLNSTVEITPTYTSKEPKRSSKNGMQIHTAKHLLRNCLLVIDKLQDMHTYLTNNAAVMSSSDWRKNTLQIGIFKNDFSKLFSKFENPDSISHLIEVVDERRKKRKYRKRRRKQERDVVKEIFKQRMKRNEEVNQWLESKKGDIDTMKMEENMKKDADCVLAEVTKKKSDARKCVALVNSLIKLRNVREKAALQKGERVSHEDRVAFAKASDHLIKIWTDALQAYNKEEQRLHMKLEQAATEDTKEKRVVEEWEIALFGPKFNPTPTYWGLTAAKKDLETFIAIRKSWDTFLTTTDDTGSRIPIGWVIPSLHADDGWAKYLQ